ncbi:MAG: hypothetical protein IJP92_15755 [Lachnospiraceae bacterium]|nr:hypothetical protein [Lachnospiraceae bacterium]
MIDARFTQSRRRVLRFPAFPKKEGVVNWSLVEGGVVLVYCDALVQEVYLPVIENVYHVFRCCGTREKTFVMV